MIDGVDRRIEGWLQASLEGVEVTWQSPPTPCVRACIRLLLLDILDAPPPRGDSIPPLQVRLRYLAFAHAPDVESEHRLLGRLIFTLLDPESPERPEVDVVCQPPSPELWRALEMTPRPCIGLIVPLRKERSMPPSRRVTEPLRMLSTRLSELSGVVLGPGDLPIAGAEVELGGLDRHTNTDSSGRFVLHGLPTPTIERPLMIRTKGRRHSVTVDPSTATSREPIVIRIPFTES